MRRLGLALCIVTALEGCAESRQPAPSAVGVDGAVPDRQPPLACTPGKQEACDCVRGVKGAQVCEKDGRGFGRCDCPAEEPRAAPRAFSVDVPTVQKAFLEYFPNVADGHKLEGTSVAIGDLNGDGKPDAIVEYALEVTTADGLGNGNGFMDGLLVFENIGDAVKAGEATRKFTSGEYFFVRYKLSGIADGVVTLEGYQGGMCKDGPCPPTLVNQRLVLRGGHLAAIR